MKGRPLFMIECQERIGKNARADLAQELMVKMDVVLAEELPAERLAGLGEVVKIGAGIPLAGRAIACGIELFLRKFINSPPELKITA